MHRDGGGGWLGGRRLVLAAALLLAGTTRLAFIALGLTLPGLMLQDSWRYSFFAACRGSQAFLNDCIWAATLLPAMVFLRLTGNKDVFWFVLAWARPPPSRPPSDRCRPGSYRSCPGFTSGCGGIATSDRASLRRTPPAAQRLSCAPMALASCWVWPPSAPCKLRTR